MNSRGLRKGPAAGLLLVVALVLLIVGAAALPAQAAAKDWRIDRMDAALDVQKNGDVEVREDVTFTFIGSYSYVGRVIPTDNLDGIENVRVLQNGQELPTGVGPGTFQTFYEGSNLVIQFNFDLTDTSETWQISYLAKGAIHFFDEGDELRWYVFDAETPVPIMAASATVTLPDPVPAEDLSAAVDTGALVSNETYSPEPGVLRYEAQDFPPYTKFWLVAGFPKGVVEFHWTWRRVAAAVVPRVAFLVPILVLLGMILTWRRRGRDEPAAVYAKFVTAPPSDLSPGIAGALVDEKVEVREVVATIIDLARRGYLEIYDKTEGPWIFKSRTTTFRKIRPVTDLYGYERQVVDALFAKGDEVTSLELKNKFYAHVPGIVNAIYDEVVTRKLFRSNPKTVRAVWLGIGVAFGVVTVIFSILLGMVGVPGWGFLLFGCAIGAVIIMVFSPFMPQRTVQGAQEQRRWEAFRNYLQDLDRYQDMASARETFERYLPYAVAFGVERDWVRRFQDLQVPGPIWYHPMMPGEAWAGPGRTGGAPGIPVGGGLPGGLGAGAFTLDSISDGLFGSLGSLSNVLTSRPSSSGSGRGAFGGGGGGFGGGFSGGGGGGGFRAG